MACGPGCDTGEAIRGGERFLSHKTCRSQVVVAQMGVIFTVARQSAINTSKVCFQMWWGKVAAGGNVGK